MATPWKRPTSGVYYYRKSIPKALRPAMQARFGMGNEVKISLETKDPATAKRRWPKADLDCQRMFEAAQGRAGTEAFQERARDWASLVDGEEGQDALLNQWTPDSTPDGEYVGSPQERMPRAIVEGIVGNFTEEDEGAARKVAWTAWERAASNQHTLEDALDGYLKERTPSAKTEDEWRRAVKRFGGNRYVRGVTRAEVVAFKDGLLEQGLARPTARKYIGALSVIFDFALEREWRDDNPAKGIKIREGRIERERRLPYTSEHLAAIFGGPIYTEGSRPRGGGGEAAYWLPLLALYTGARLQELGQLRRADVRETDGVWCIEIGDEGEDQRIKNASSRRTVPLHPDIREAFVEYAKKQKGALFPDLRPDIKGNVTGNFSKWWGRYARGRFGITDTRYTFHSFRHSFKTLCRDAGVPTDIHDRLTGHSGGNVGSGYGGVGVKRLAEYAGMLQAPVKLYVPADD